MKKALAEIKKFLMDEDGLTTAEWVILASAVTVAAIAVVGLIMPKIRTMANKVGDSLSQDPYDPNSGSGSN